MQTMTQQDTFKKYHFIGRRDSLRNEIPLRRKYRTYAAYAGYVYGYTSDREHPRSAADDYQDWKQARAKGIEI